MFGISFFGDRITFGRGNNLECSGSYFDQMSGNVQVLFHKKLSQQAQM